MRKAILENAKLADRSAKCRSCIYSTDTNIGQDGHLTACYYIVITGKRRPCQPGERCTEYKEREDDRRNGQNK